MSEILGLLRKLLGFQEETSYTASRKRRLEHHDVENFTAKLRRTTNMKMSSDEWLDAPSTSKNSYIRYPTRRSSIRPLSLRNTDILEISDDDDIQEVPAPPPRTSSPQTSLNGFDSRLEKRQRAYELLRQARKSMEYCRNTLINPSKVSNVIRPLEQQRYHDMLLQSPTTAAAYRDSSRTPLSRRLLELAGETQVQTRLKPPEKKPPPIIDLTDEKSSGSGKDSAESDVEIVSVKRKVQPVNSYKKQLEAEPFMRPTYIAKMEQTYQQRVQTTGRFINEELKKVQEFSSINKQNVWALLTQKVKNCQLNEVILLEEYEPPEPALPPLSGEQEARVKEALNSRSQTRIFAEKFNLKITGSDLKCLNDNEWLNDEVINFYVNLIMERSQRAGLPNVYSFSTFFYSKLVTSGYKSLRRWTRRVDVFTYDLIVVPVHLGFHWCMAIIDFRDKSIRYYDSMRGNNMQCLSALENYLQEESMDKKNCEFDMSDWQKVIMKDIPRQMNGSDCGVFSCTFAEFVSRNAKILFTQEHMPYIRRKMVIEIIEGRLLT